MKFSSLEAAGKNGCFGAVFCPGCFGATCFEAFSLACSGFGPGFFRFRFRDLPLFFGCGSSSGVRLMGFPSSSQPRSRSSDFSSSALGSSGMGSLYSPFRVYPRRSTFQLWREVVSGPSASRTFTVRRRRFTSATVPFPLGVSTWASCLGILRIRSS